MALPAALMAIIPSLIEKASDKLIDVIPDKEARDKRAHDIVMEDMTNAHAISLAQLEVNRTEAAHKSLFVAGWRPFVGWVCGLALAGNYLVTPYLQLIWPTLNPLDFAVMSPILLGMLGLGTMRSTEKVKGVSREK